MTIKKNVAGVVLIALIILIGYAISLKVSPAEPTIKIGYQTNLTHQHLFVALEKGYFAEEGVNVEAVKFGSANLMMDALLTDKIDATSMSSSHVLFSVEQSMHGSFKIYTAYINTREKFVDYILVQKESEISSIADLKGKKLGTFPGSTIKTYAKVALSHFLNPEKDITIVELAPQLQMQALSSGQVDALYTLEPIATLVLAKGVGKVLLENPGNKYAVNPLVAAAGVFSTRFVEEHPEEAKGVKNALDKAIDFLEDTANRKEVVQIAAKYTGFSPEIISKTHAVEYWKLTEIDKKAVQKLADFFFEQGVLDKKIDTTHMYLGTQ